VEKVTWRELKINDGIQYPYLRTPVFVLLWTLLPPLLSFAALKKLIAASQFVKGEK
jgi:hypothetical protein